MSHDHNIKGHSLNLDGVYGIWSKGLVPGGLKKSSLKSPSTTTGISLDSKELTKKDNLERMSSYEEMGWIFPRNFETFFKIFSQEILILFILQVEGGLPESFGFRVLYGS
ncbi:hypothetical protein BpHYR1_026000, partial [Brachionus plicatilis]